MGLIIADKFSSIGIQSRFVKKEDLDDEVLEIIVGSRP